MPLDYGKGKKAFGHNVGAELKAGKPRAQAVAIAYSVACARAKKKRKEQ